MTPSERLLKAAELLEERASEATEGPWTARVFDGEDHDYSDVIGKQEVEQYSGSYTLTTALVAGGYAEVGEAGWIAAGNARYIATMHPGVASSLAALLRWEADAVAFNDGRCALALADLLLAGEQ